MITPSIHFQGNCDEAIKFYKKTLGAEVKEISYAKDAPAGSGMDKLPPNYVMYSDIIMYGAKFMLSDGGEAPLPYGNFSFMVTLDTEDEVKKVFEALANGGKITQPLSKQFFSSLYGEAVDRFGVAWQVMIKQE